jgi:hypothetical protein
VNKRIVTGLVILAVVGLVAYAAWSYSGSSMAIGAGPAVPGDGSLPVIVPVTGRRAPQARSRSGSGGAPVPSTGSTLGKNQNV